MSHKLSRRTRHWATNRWSRPVQWSALFVACLLHPSCTSSRSVSFQQSPQHSTRQPAPLVASAPASAPATVSLDEHLDVEQTTYRAQGELTVLKEAVIASHPTEIEQVGGEVDARPIDSTVSGPVTMHECQPREEITTPGCPQDTPYCPAYPPSQPIAAPVWSQPAAPPPEPMDYGDEYICDGGDEGYPVHYHGPEMKGLETEDTVVEFYDNHNQRRVEPSNKVCIYAPRFAAVSSTTAPIAGVQIAKVAGTHDGQKVGGFNARMRIDENRHVDQVDTFRMRSRASGLNLNLTDNVFDGTQSVEVHSKLVNLFEARKFISDGQYVQGEQAIIADGMAAAGTWSRDLYPVISASDVTGQAVTNVFKVEAMTAVEDPSGPGQLRVVKLADKSVAEVGDTIEFTIRIDNLGGLELREVVLVDNLTPRLEFVEGSATHTLDGELLVEDNGEGSSKLTFRLIAPLAGKTGGVLKFQCLVR